MAGTTLTDIERLVDQLDVRDQVRLLQFLAPRIAGGVLSAAALAPDVDAAWRQFREVGARLAKGSSGGGGSLTQAVSDMRR